MRSLSVILCLFALLVVPSATADEAKKIAIIETFADGGVKIKDQYFGNQLEFQQSDLFRLGGYRCGSQNSGMILTIKDAAHCSMTSTTITSQYSPAWFAAQTYRIPVVFHIIQRTGGTGNISNSLIQSQLDILNEDFLAISGSLGGNGTDTRIEFYLATTDPNGNSTTGINRHTSNAYFTDPGPNVYNDMKQALNWDPARYLNIYTNDSAGYLGYATFPQEDAEDAQDGVVLLHSSVGRNAPNGGIYDQGRTATHEVGHYLGLFHTFQGGCGSSSAPYTSGDLIQDTNRQQSANFNCPASATSCSSSDPIENYMNYTQDTCMEEFTLEQANRMRCSIESYRWTLVSSNPPLPAPANLWMTFDGEEELCVYWNSVSGAAGYYLHTVTYQPYRVLSGTGYCRELKPKYLDSWKVSVSAYATGYVEGTRTSPYVSYCDLYPSSSHC